MNTTFKNNITLSLAMLILGLNCFCQIDSIPDVPFQRSLAFVQFTGTIQLQDSQYFLVTTLNVTENDSIEVRKSRLYDQDHYGVNDGRLFLQRIVRNYFVNITTDGFKQFDIYDTICNIPKVVLHKNHPITDTVALGDLFPFEIGRYRISAELEYLYRGEKCIARTKIIYFDAPIIPRSYCYY